MRTKVVDQWQKADGTHTPRHGKGKRYLARWEHQNQRGSKAFHRKTQARDWLHQQKHLHQRNNLVPEGKATVTDWLNQWHRTKQAEEATRAAYRRTIDRHITPAIGDRQLADLRDHHIEALYAQMPRTMVNKAHTVLNQALRQAVKQGFIFTNPLDTVDKPKTVRPKTITHVLTPEQVNAVAGQLAEPDRMIFTVMVETGLRPGEMAALAVEQVDWDRRLIVVDRAMKQPFGLLGMTKTKRERMIPMTANVQAILERCAEQAEKAEVPHADNLPGDRSMREFLFPCGDAHYEAPLPHHLWAGHRFKSALNKAGLSLDGQSIYITRHTFASSLIRSGCDVREVSDLMGHSTVAFTLNRYAHLFETDWSSVIGRLDRMYGAEE